MNKNQKVTIDLSKEEKTICNGYIKINSVEGSNQKRITVLCEKGKQGHESIIRIAQYLKANNEKTDTLKVQVNRAMGRLKTGLSLQGLGKDMTIEDITIAPKQDAKGGHSGKSEGGEGESKSTATTITKEQVWEFVATRFTKDEIDALVSDWKDRQQAMDKAVNKALKKVA